MIHEECFVDDVGGDAVMVIALFILFVLEVIRMSGSWGFVGAVDCACRCWWGLLGLFVSGLLEVTGLCCCCCWECWFFT